MAAFDEEGSGPHLQNHAGGPTSVVERRHVDAGEAGGLVGVGGDEVGELEHPPLHGLDGIGV